MATTGWAGERRARIDAYAHSSRGVTVTSDGRQHSGSPVEQMEVLRPMSRWPRGQNLADAIGNLSFIPLEWGSER